MAKIVYDLELAEIVREVIEQGLIEDPASYESFLFNIANALCYACGGIPGNVVLGATQAQQDAIPDDEFEDMDGQELLDLRASVAIYKDDVVPADEGIWKAYDPQGWEGE
jgi:hypothetical protein